MRNKNHLNKEIRNIIEELLDKNYTFTDIAKTIYKDRRTISRDILKHTNASIVEMDTVIGEQDGKSFLTLIF